MKKLNYFALLLAAFVLIISSCGKDGAVGPTGPAGPTGTAGAQGAVGPAGPSGANGKNGSTIYSGTTAPATTTGAVGDYYINLSTGILYGPKAAAGWGTGISLKGANGTNGAAGAAGSKIYSGTAAPATTLGAIGDYYLDKTNYMLYGPKTASSWGTPVNLKGAAGNANVKTDEFTIAPTDWLWNSQYLYETGAGSYTEYFTRYTVRNNNTITQDVLDNGMVLVYFQPSPVNNPNEWLPLPYQFDSSFGYTYNYAYVTALGKVTFHFFFTLTSSTATPPQLSTYTMVGRKFKIITVTGKTGVFMTQQHINTNNYNEVSKALGLWH